MIDQHTKLIRRVMRVDAFPFNWKGTVTRLARTGTVFVAWDHGGPSSWMSPGNLKELI